MLNICKAFVETAPGNVHNFCDIIGLPVSKMSWTPHPTPLYNPVLKEI